MCCIVYDVHTDMRVLTGEVGSTGLALGMCFCVSFACFFLTRAKLCIYGLAF